MRGRTLGRNAWNLPFRKKKNKIRLWPLEILRHKTLLLQYKYAADALRAWISCLALYNLVKRECTVKLIDSLTRCLGTCARARISLLAWESQNRSLYLARLHSAEDEARRLAGRGTSTCMSYDSRTGIPVPPLVKTPKASGRLVNWSMTVRAWQGGTRAYGPLTTETPAHASSTTTRFLIPRRPKP